MFYAQKHGLVNEDRDSILHITHYGLDGRIKPYALNGAPRSLVPLDYSRNGHPG